MENGDTLLFSLQKANLMNGATPEKSALQQENKTTPSVYHSQ